VILMQLRPVRTCRKAAHATYGCADPHAGDIRGWWIWAYWVNPVTYSMRALTMNEFTAPRWAIPDPQNPAQTLGVAVLQTYGYDHAHWWRFAPIGILCGYIILMNVIIALALRFLSGAYAFPREKLRAAALARAHCVVSSCVHNP